MENKISLKSSFDLIFAILSALGFLAVIQTFVIFSLNFRLGYGSLMPKRKCCFWKVPIHY